MTTILNKALDLIVELIPWRPTAWDVPIMDWRSASMWSKSARRWVEAP